MSRRSPSNSTNERGALPDEDRLVEILTRGLPQSARTLTGPGDDCAVVRIPGSPMLQLLKADAVVEGVHFTRAMPPALVGRKALGRAVSDIASMGGRPNEALITLVLPRDVPLGWVRVVYAGMRRAAAKWGVGLAGGETSSAPAGAPVVISVALTGEVREGAVARRDGAVAGDVIAVTGRLGNSFASGRHLSFEPRIEEAWWLAGASGLGGLRAMMDLSDGLAKDLPRMAAAGGVGWRLDLDRVPVRRGATLRQALEEGEDYELLAVFRPEVWEQVETAWRERFPKVELTRIGEIAGRRTRAPKLSGGWDHFAEDRAK